MIFEKDESETDYRCHKGESLQKIATESPEKWYIPLEHYTRVTENLCLELRQLRDERRALLDANSIWKWSAIALLAVSLFLAFTRQN